MLIKQDLTINFYSLEPIGDLVDHAKHLHIVTPQENGEEQFTSRPQMSEAALKAPSISVKEGEDDSPSESSQSDFSHKPQIDGEKIDDTTDSLEELEGEGDVDDPNLGDFWNSKRTSN